MPKSLPAGAVMSALARTRWPVPPMLAVLVAALLAVVVVAAPAAAVAPSVSVSITGPAEVLAGDSATYSFSATNDGATAGFNLGFALDVPVGVAFVSSTYGEPTIYDALNPPATPLAAGLVRWVWEDVSDLPATGTSGGSVTVMPAQPAIGGGETAVTTVFPVGATFEINGYAYASGDATLLPVFNGSTGIGGPTAIAETASAGPDTASTLMIPLRLEKSEPSPESELLRGVHDQTTVYTLTATNTTQGPTNDAVLVDFIPAALEFLGCGLEDNSLVDRDAADAAINEYDGASLLTSTPAVTADCPAPTSVTTVVATASDATTYGVTEGQVYTRVEWNLGTLAADSVTTVRYAAGIPLYENTTTWDVTATEPRDPAVPSGTSLEQTANLDNNNGPSTRHGSVGAAIDGDAWTNAANVVGAYAGVVRTAATRVAAAAASYTIDAMDLSVLKAVAPSDKEFVVGNVADFTLTLRASEYMDSSAIVLTDTLPNGLCPLMPVGTELIEDTVGLVPAECKVTGTVVGADMISVTAHNDGTFDVVFRPTSATFPDADNFVLASNETHDITYEALDRAAYELDDAYGSTTSGDGFSNAVQFVAVTDAIAPLQAAFADTWDVWDDSSASLSTELTTISKKVLPRDSVVVDAAPDADPCTASGYTSTLQPGFRMGDTACFELRVDFPGSVDVRNALVTDFLPDGLTFAGYAVAAASTVPSSEVAVDESKTDAGRISWELGAVGALGDRYVTRGDVFVVHVWATVDVPSNGPILDKPENLMKYQQQNVEGDLYFLRSEAAIEVDPELTLIKGVWTVKDNAGVSSSTRTAASQDSADGGTFGSNRDGIMVREGETVTYRVDLSTAPYPADNAVIWDVLPDGIVATDVTRISDLGQAYDPADLGYPATITPALNARSVIVWTDVAVTDVDVAGVFRKTLDYDVLIPTPTGVTKTLDNDASIISYTAGINTSSVVAGQVYYPAGAFDEDPARVANTVGDSTRDDSSVYLPAVAVAKARTSPVLTGPGPDFMVNNTAGQVVKGEVAQFDYSVTIPAYTTVFNGVLQDIVDTTNWSIDVTATSVTDPYGVITSAPATGFTTDGEAFTFDPATGRVTFPATYTNDTAVGKVFTVHLEAHVKSGSAWTHSTTTQRSDTARFSSTGAANTNATAEFRLIEPRPLITKIVNDDTVTAGQTVTYTLTASNTAARPTSFDTFVGDCVPAELTVTAGDLGAPSAGSVVIDPDIANACDGTLIVWTIGSLNAGTPATLTYSATVSPASAGGASYTNTARITGYSMDDPTADRATYTRSTPEVITVIGSALTKTVDAPTATIGEERDYTITATIPADVNFYDAAIVDDVPAGMAVSAVSISCEDADAASCDADLPASLTPLTTSGTLHGWLLGDLTSDAKIRTITVTYTGTVLDVPGNVWTPTATALLNTARMRWNATDGTNPTSAGDTWTQGTSPDTATVTVVEPSLGVAKLVNGTTSDTVNPGDPFTYTVTVTNAGTSTGYDITVTDAVPDGVIVTGGTISDGGSLSGATATGGGTITWTLSSLAVGAANAKHFTYDATLASSDNLTAAALTNTATVTEYYSHPGTTPGFDDLEVRQYGPTNTTADVTPGFPDPVITKSAVGGTVAYIGANKSFTIRVYNGGAGPAEGVEVTDDLPVGFAYVTGSATVTGVVGAVNPTVSGDPETTGQTLTWSTLPNIAPDGAITIAYQAVALDTHTWDAANTGSDVAHTNNAHVAVDDTSGSPLNADGVFEDADDATVTINDANLSLTKGHSAPIVAGANATWTLSVYNGGLDAAVGPIVITDTLPTGAVLQSISGTDWTAGTPDGSNVVTLTYSGSLASGATSVVQVIVRFPADTASGTDAANSACVAARTLDTDTSDNCATDPGTVIVEADVQLEKTLTATDYVAGEPISWDLTATNNGPSVSHSPFTITDSLPAGVDWSSVTSSGSGWACGTADGAGDIDCTWTGTALAVGDSLPTLTLTANVLSATTGTLTNSATVYPTTAEPAVPGTSNNSDSVTTGALGAIADLGIVKTVDSAEIVAGGTGRYRMEVTNNGPSDALRVIVTDQLPTGLTYAGGLTSAAGATWTCTPSGSVTGQVDCVLTSNTGTLVDGDSTWFEFDVDVASDVTAEVVNTATVSSDTDDDNPDNDTDSARQNPFVETNISLAKTHNATTVYRVGDEVVFTLTVTNDGTADAVDVTIADTIPAGTTFARVENNTGWTVEGPTAGVLTLTLDDPLPAGDPNPTASIDVVLTLGADSVPGVTNVAAVTTATVETTMADNPDTDPVEVDTPDLVIEKSVHPAIVMFDDTFTYTLRVSNVDDDAAADDITVTDPIPASLKVLDDPADIGGDDWACALTGQAVDGFGGTLTCDLATLEAGTTASLIRYDVSISPATTGHKITNVATVSSPSEDSSKVDGLNDDDATVTVAYSAAEFLAFTGLESSAALWWALGLLLAGIGALIFGRRRRLG